MCVRVCVCVCVCVCACARACWDGIGTSDLHNGKGLVFETGHNLYNWIGLLRPLLQIANSVLVLPMTNARVA